METETTKASDTPALRFTDPGVAPIPAAISSAIAAVMAEIEVLAKAEENKFANYKYASVDAFYGLICPLLAKHKLVIVPIEAVPVRIVRVESGDKVKNWAHFVIGFVFSVGEVTYYDPRITETLFIQIEGPQTFNGAKSYAQKTLMRQLFKVPTKDFDLDETGPDAVEDGEPKKAKKKAKAAPDPLSPEASKVARDLVIAHLDKAKKPLTPQEREDFAEKFGAEIACMTDGDKAIIRQAFKDATQKAAGA